jgi:hypothetical protein
MTLTWAREALTRARKALTRSQGFTIVELTVSALIITVLIIVLLPRFMSLTHKVRLADARQDALYIGAVIEELKIEGVFSPDAPGLLFAIYEKAGRRFDGQVSDLYKDGCFIYSKAAAGKLYVVRYDSPTGSVFEVLPDDEWVEQE